MTEFGRLVLGAASEVTETFTDETWPGAVRSLLFCVRALKIEF